MQEDKTMQMWLIGGFVVLVVAATVAAAVLSKGQNTSVSNFTPTTAAAITAADHARGNASSKVSVIEYGDFQCPACGEYEPIVEQLYKTYGDRVNFVFRNFPLFQIHQNAMMSAQAAEAAGLQGKYWEMHDLLYGKQAEWSNDAPGSVVSKHFDGYAKSLGLDVKRFDIDITSAAVQDAVQSGLASGNAAKVDHTPTFFINLTEVQNPQSYGDFSKRIDTALASSTHS